jgi:hypothetical protein
MPYIFHIDIYFIFLRKRKSAIFRLLIKYFHVIQNSRQNLRIIRYTDLHSTRQGLVFTRTRQSPLCHFLSLYSTAAIGDDLPATIDSKV